MPAPTPTGRAAEARRGPGPAPAFTAALPSTLLVAFLVLLLSAPSGTTRAAPLTQDAPAVDPTAGEEAEDPDRCRLAGLVRLHGRTAFAGTEVLLDGEAAASTAGSGFFEIGGLEPGFYRLTARHPSFLSAEVEAVECRTDRVTRMPDFDLPGGDITRDQSVDLFDLVRVGRGYGLCASDADFDPAVDLNQSGCIDLFDLVLVGTNYGLVGPVDWPLPSGRFATEILPIMQRYCVPCHGTVAGLRLDSYASVMAGGISGPSVVPGEPDRSSLYTRLLGQGGPIMPPGGVRVSADEIAVVEAWIEAGAPEN